MFSSILHRRHARIVVGLVATASLAAPSSSLASGSHRPVPLAISRPVHSTVSGSIVFSATGVGGNAHRVLFAIDGRREWSTNRQPYRYHRSGVVNTRKLRNGRHVLVLEAFYPNRRRTVVRKTIVVKNRAPAQVAARKPRPALTSTFSVGVVGPPAGGVPGPSVTAFNRETYQYSTTWSAAQEAGRYQVLVLAGNEASLIPHLKALNPNLKILLYQAIMETNSNDYSYMPTVTGCTAYATDAANNPSWILHDQNGNPVYSRGTTDHYITDVGNPAYQQACATSAAALAKQYGFDGVFFDMVQGQLSWSVNASVRVPEYPTGASWSSAMTSAVSYLGPALHAQGLLVFGNVSGTPSTTVWEQWAGALDGVEEESWTDGGLGLTQQIPFWSSKFAELNWAQQHGKYEILHSYNRAQAANTYGLAAMLLATNGEASYSTSNSNYTSNENWFPEYTAAQSLGAAAGPYRVLTNGVYERVFSNGIVLVNPTGKSVRGFSLGGGTYSGSGVSHASSVSLSPTSGLILKAG